jgi:hypothetical protein
MTPERSPAVRYLITIIGVVCLFCVRLCTQTSEAQTPPAFTPSASTVTVNPAGVVISPTGRQLPQVFTAATRATTIPVAVGQLGFETDTGNLYRATAPTAGAWLIMSGGGGGGAAVWGGISGNLSAQEDLSTALANLNATNLTTGTVPAARLPTPLPALNAAALTDLNASNLATGTIPAGRFPATLPALNGSLLTNLNAANLTGALPAINGGQVAGLNAANLTIGTIPDGRFPATLPASNAGNLTNLTAAALSGTINPLRLPSRFNLPLIESDAVSGIFMGNSMRIITGNNPPNPTLFPAGSVVFVIDGVSHQRVVTPANAPAWIPTRPLYPSFVLHPPSPTFTDVFIKCTLDNFSSYFVFFTSTDPGAVAYTAQARNEAMMRITVADRSGADPRTVFRNTTGTPNSDYLGGAAGSLSSIEVFFTNPDLRRLLASQVHVWEVLWVGPSGPEMAPGNTAEMWRMVKPSWEYLLPQIDSLPDL